MRIWHEGAFTQGQPVQPAYLAWIHSHGASRSLSTSKLPTELELIRRELHARVGGGRPCPGAREVVAAPRASCEEGCRAELEGVPLEELLARESFAGDPSGMLPVMDDTRLWRDLRAASSVLLGHRDSGGSGEASSEGACLVPNRLLLSRLPPQLSRLERLRWVKSPCPVLDKRLFSLSSTPGMVYSVLEAERALARDFRFCRQKGRAGINK